LAVPDNTSDFETAQVRIAEAKEDESVLTQLLQWIEVQKSATNVNNFFLFFFFFLFSLPSPTLLIFCMGMDRVAFSGSSCKLWSHMVLRM
jgi:hypothetical protein